MENYREYTGRSQRKPAPKKKAFPYLKKLLRQSIISLLLLGIIFSPWPENAKNTSKIKEAVKSALNYKPDTKKISDILSNILKATQNRYHQGESNEEQISPIEKAF